MPRSPRAGAARLFRTTLILSAAVLGAACASLPRAGAGEANEAAPWGKAVDGLVCRLVLEPRYAIGQAIGAVIEIKNTSDRRRYLVPRLDPQFRESLAIDITGPKGKVRQTSYSGGLGGMVSENILKPIGPGEVLRFEIPDLRWYFTDLEAWQCSPAPKAKDVPAGKYVAQFRFHSPKVGPRLYAGQTESLDGLVGPAGFQQGDSLLEIRANHWSNEAVSAPVTFQLTPLAKDDLVVHEWGVFTVFNDVKYANANRREEWGALPSFFYRQFPNERLRWLPSAWDKPIVYFYAKPTPMRVNVQVTFPEGAPVVWWPAASDPRDDWPGGIQAKKPRPFRDLTWEAWLGDQVPFPGPGKATHPAKEFQLPADCWLHKARLPGATPVTVTGTDVTKQKRSPGALDRPETERFIYYDGLVPTPDYLRCEKVDAASVTLRNRAKFDIPRLIVVDRRAKGAVGFASVGGADSPFKAGTARAIEPARIAAADWPAAGVKAVRQALLDAGLFAAEADALLAIWQKRLLEAEGVTVFHILPADEYRRMLPLIVLPEPATRPVRVGIALHPHMEVEPTLAVQVAALLRQLDDDDFARRDAASQALLEIGPLAIAQLRAELQKALPLEMRRRIEAVLDRVDATGWLTAPPAKGGGK
jgi:hypothetical protein